MQGRGEAGILPIFSKVLYTRHYLILIYQCPHEKLESIQIQAFESCKRKDKLQ